MANTAKCYYFLLLMLLHTNVFISCIKIFKSSVEIGKFKFLAFAFWVFVFQINGTTVIWKGKNAHKTSITVEFVLNVKYQKISA